MNRDDLIISDLIRKVVKTNSHQNNEPDMEETKEGGDTNSSVSDEELDELQSSLMDYTNESIQSLNIVTEDSEDIERDSLISSSQSSDSSSSSQSSSSSSTSESEDEEERKENLSISNS